MEGAPANCATTVVIHLFAQSDSPVLLQVTPVNSRWLAGLERAGIATLVCCSHLHLEKLQLPSQEAMPNSRWASELPGITITCRMKELEYQESWAPETHANTV